MKGLVDSCVRFPINLHKLLTVGSCQVYTSTHGKPVSVTIVSKLALKMTVLPTHKLNIFLNVTGPSRRQC